MLVPERRALPRLPGLLQRPGEDWRRPARDPQPGRGDRRRRAAGGPLELARIEDPATIEALVEAVLAGRIGLPTAAFEPVDGHPLTLHLRDGTEVGGLAVDGRLQVPGGEIRVPPSVIEAITLSGAARGTAPDIHGGIGIATPATQP